MIKNAALGNNTFGEIFTNELSKIFKSKRFSIMALSFVLIAIFSLYYLSLSANNTPGQPKFLLLQIFTTKLYFFPSFTILLAIITPIFSFSFGFDTFNSDILNNNNKNIIHYDDSIKDILLIAKSLAIMITFSLLLFILFVLLITSSSIVYQIDIRGFELMRIFAFYLLSILYSTLWYIISMFFSLRFPKKKESLFFSILAYLVVVILWAPFTLLISFAITNSRFAAENLYSLVSNLSPFILFKNATEGILLQPLNNFAPKLLNPIFMAFLIPGAPEYQNFSLILLNIIEFLAMIIFILTLGYIKIQKSQN
jgi:ABC-2 type transport system permease protein